LVEARYKFDIWEMRIFLEMLAKIRSEDSDFMDYKIYLKDFVKDFFLQDNKNTYRLVKDAAKKLMGKLIEAKINRGDGKMEDFISPVVTSFKGRDQDNEEASYIKLSFHPDMRPFLLELKERYLTYEFRNVANLSSSYYVRIYELLKQYEKIGKRKMSVEGLKAMLGIESEYKSYGHFKDKILEKSKINLLKYTDIRFEYEEITNGTRKVIDLMFYISRNVPEHRPEVKIERNFIHRPTVEIIQPQLFDPDRKGRNRRRVH
jgi:plasmid replication initiation protein